MPPARARCNEVPSIIDSTGKLEVGINTVDQIFDNRDPAPFRERTLDPHFVEYLRENGSDRIGAGQLHIVLRIASPSELGDVEHAIRSHFDHALERTRRRRREQVRTGAIALTFAAIAVIVLTALSDYVGNVVGGSLGPGLQETISISGWVLMWRPVEMLVYDSIPWRRERRLLQALRDARVEVVR